MKKTKYRRSFRNISRISWSIFATQQSRKAIEYLQKGLELQRCKKAKHIILLVSHLQLQNSQAIEYCKAIQTAAKVNDKKLATYQNNLGNAYFICKLEESMIHYKISLGLQQELLDERGAAVTLQYWEYTPTSANIMLL